MYYWRVSKYNSQYNGEMEKMLMNEYWKFIMTLVDNNDIDQIVEYCKSLEPSEYKYIEKKLLDELQHTDDNSHRNTIAIVLGDLNCSEAADIFLELIYRPELKNNRGTLVSALGELKSEQYIFKLLPLLYEGNYEVVGNTYALLEENVDKMPKEEKERCANFIKDRIRYYEDILGTLYAVYEDVFEQTSPTKEG